MYLKIWKPLLGIRSYKVESLLIFLVSFTKFTGGVPGTILEAENIRRARLVFSFQGTCGFNQKVDVWIYNWNMIVEVCTRKGNITEDENLNLMWESQGRLSRNEDSELGLFSKMDRRLSRDTRDKDAETLNWTVHPENWWIKSTRGSMAMLTDWLF